MGSTSVNNKVFKRSEHYFNVSCEDGLEGSLGGTKQKASNSTPGGEGMT